MLDLWKDVQAFFISIPMSLRKSKHFLSNISMISPILNPKLQQLKEGTLSWYSRLTASRLFICSTMVQSESQPKQYIFLFFFLHIFSRPTYDCPSLCLHEAVPGHHHQVLSFNIHYHYLLSPSIDKWTDIRQLYFKKVALDSLH